MSGAPATSFREVQSFSRNNLRLALAIPPFVFVVADVWQIGLGHSIKQPALSNASLIGWTVFLWLIYLRLITMRLITEVRKDELVVTLRGLWRSRHIPLSNIKSRKALHCDPVRDYGGYGFRPIRNGRAYIASGNEAVRLELADGTVIVIGSQRANELVGALSRSPADKKGI